MKSDDYRFFRIDSLGKGIFVKCLFAVLLLVKCSIYFWPIGDPDFSEFVAWTNSLLNNYDPMAMIDFETIPFTFGNAIYLCHTLATNLVLIMGACLYAGVFIRQYRIEHQPNKPGASGYLIPPQYLKPISVPKLILRMIILSLCALVVFFPALLFVLYLFIVFIIIFPCVAMYPACYLSGDNGLFKSLVDMVKVSKGYYIVNMRSMSLLMCLYFIGDYITSWIMQLQPAFAYVLGPVLAVFVALATGRYVGIVYCRMREVPGGLRISNQASVPPRDRN